MLRNGSFRIPAAISRFVLNDHYVLVDHEGTKFGIVECQNGSIVGLRTFFRRRGGEIGDFVRIEFDNSNSSAKITFWHGQEESNDLAATGDT